MSAVSITCGQEHRTKSSESYMLCQLQEPTHYAAIFRGGDYAYLQVVQLTDWDYSKSKIDGSFLDELNHAAPESHAIYNVEGMLSWKRSVKC